MRGRPGPNRRDRWKAKLATAPSVPPACRIFCIHVLAKHMNAQGIVSRPRYRLAAEANVSERRVTQFVTQAKEGGWLIVVQPGYRGMTAVYQATFPDAQRGNGSFPLSRAERGKDASPLSAGTGCSRFPAEKGERIVPATSSYLLGNGDHHQAYPRDPGFDDMLRAASNEVAFDFGDESKSNEDRTRHLRVVNG